MRLLSLLPLLLLCWWLTPPTAAWYDQDDDDQGNKHHLTVIQHLDDFKHTVLGSDDIWLVHFCEPTDPRCQDLEGLVTNLATLFRGFIQFGVVNMEDEEMAQLIGIDRAEGMHSFYWFLDHKTSATKLEAPPHLEKMVKSIMGTVGEVISHRAKTMNLGVKFTTKEQDDDEKPKKKQEKKDKPKKPEPKTIHVEGLDAWNEHVIYNPQVVLVAFTAPWCGHCKKLQPEFDRAAIKLDKQGGQLVWVDATHTANVRFLQDFDVKGYPTLMMFPGGQPKSPLEARVYEQDRTTMAMVDAVLHEVDVSGIPKELPELVSRNVLEQECQGHNHICVLAALPHILDSGAAGRNHYKALVQQVSKKFRGGAFSFLWFQGGDQPALEQALELTFGYPALVAYSMDRNAFAVLHGAFNEQAMTKFLHGVTNGRVSIGKLAKEQVPPIETVEPWDGLDAAPPEEEFSLEDIMGDSDEDEPAGGGGDEL